MDLSLIPAAMAAQAQTAGPHGEAFSSLLLLLGFVVIFYFLLWRPQSKRAKEHKTLLEGLQKGDEVVTSGGVVGKIAKLADRYVILQIAEDVEIAVEMQSVVKSLPKGTLKAL